MFNLLHIYYIYVVKHILRIQLFYNMCYIFYVSSVEVRVSRVRLFATPWTIQSRPEYWSGQLIPSPGESS